MKIQQNQTNSFGRRFLIRELPVGEKVLSSGRIGAMLEYSMKKLPKSENSQNVKTNKSIKKLIEKIQKKFGKTNKVEVRTKTNRSLLLRRCLVKSIF